MLHSYTSVLLPVDNNRTGSISITTSMSDFPMFQMFQASTTRPGNKQASAKRH